MWFKLLMLVHLYSAFPLKCPEPAQWAQRANGHCADPSKYFCLKNDLINGYSENCTRSDFQQPGRKAVLRGGIDADICSKERYQPFPIRFYTNVSTHCLFLKSFCNEEGQVVYEHGDHNTDTTCRCDYRRSYDFLIKPKNTCFCKPPQEDCSCYLKTCSNTSHILSPDYQCIYKTDLNRLAQCRLITDEEDIIKISEILETTPMEQNVSVPVLVKWNNRAAIVVLSLVLICGTSSVVFVLLKTDLKWLLWTYCCGVDTPADINRLQKLMQRSETEKRYFVKIMIVGKESVGKTCLLRRLLKENIEDVSSTDGVDIVVRRCKINIEDGNWIIDKDLSDDRADRIRRALKNDKNVQDKSIVNEINKMNLPTEAENLNNTRNTTKPFQLDTNTQLLDKTNEEVPAKQNISLLDNASTNDIKDNNITLESDNVREFEVKHNEIVTNTDIKDTLSLSMPSDLMSCVFSTTSTSNIPSNHYALCGLWDFAGQKEFYATHQAFLTNNAIYLVVANMADDISKQDVKQVFADFQHVGEYVDFWFDTIHSHSHRIVEPQVTKPSNDHIQPPVILVFTGKDEYEKKTNGKKSVDNRKTELQTQLDLILGEQSKYHHLRKIFWLSNMTDPDVEFENLRLEISATAMKMENWGQSMSLKWILLEHLIEINKKSGMNFINLSDMLNLAKHTDINIQDIVEVLSFLRFQHEEGNIIFFDDLQEFIILNPKWLIDAFRCLVSDKIDDTLQHRQDLSTFLRNGILSKSLITELFKSKCGNQFSDQEQNLIKVMEKFDILVEISGEGSYIVPSMMQSLSFDEVSNCIGVEEPNCKRTSWLCLKFSFLPPAFFNHLSVWFISNYEPSKVKNEKQSLALFRGICIFDIDKTGCDKILFTMSSNTIALQLLSFSTVKKEFAGICNKIRKDLIEKTNAMKKRYKLTISYELHFKCSTGHYYEDTKSYQDLIDLPEYYCNQHKGSHRSETIYLPWMKNADKEKPQINTEQEQTNIENNSPVKCHYCEKMPVYRCYECSNVLCDDCYLKHDKLTNTVDHTFQSTNDKLLLNNKFEVSDAIIDIKSLPGGLLVFVVFRSNTLLTYSVSDNQQNEISVGKQPRSIAIVDRNTVVVLLSPGLYVKIDSIGIVDIRQRQVIQHVEVTLDLPFYRFCPMFYTDDQLYISSYSGITVTDMSGTIDREIELGFKPRDMCYDTKAARIYCIDDSEKKLICIDRDGNTIFTFTDTSLTNTKHLTIDNEGYVLILCHEDYNFKNFKVHRISPDGKSGEVIITGKQNYIYTDSVSSICFQEESDKLVIGMAKTVYTYKKN